MAKKISKLKAKEVTVETLTHEDARRKNIPTAEYQALMQKKELTSIKVAYERRNKDLDPQLVWRGKDVTDWSDLIVSAPPLYIQEKVHPKVLIDSLAKTILESDPDQVEDPQIDLFANFNGLPNIQAKTEFYQHDAHWTNRLILGDSLQVMASLAEREGLRGKVQCIYFDPPYGIRFNSNFQWSTTSKEVGEGAEHITREPEQVKAFRDTWRDGIHSYLTYLRDRLTVARDLLSDSGSIFVQIGTENVHRVRLVLDEVFGDDCCISEILVKKKGSQKGGGLEPVNDFILWYGKSKRKSGAVKIRELYEIRDTAEMLNDFPYVELASGERIRLSDLEKRDDAQYSSDYKSFKAKYPGARHFAANPLKSGGYRRQQSHDFIFQNKTFPIKPGQCWKHTVIEDDSESIPGMERLARAERLFPQQRDVRFVKHSPIPSIKEISNWWDGFGGAPNQVYVVQTNERILERCILMASDPGDLVLDPTCGSGTTAVVAEQWGRRWVTIDTSRVALALTRARIMGSRFSYYLLADSQAGQIKLAELSKSVASAHLVGGNIRHGFVYERSINVTSGSIANNKEIDVIWEKWQPSILDLLKRLNKELKRDSKNLLEEWQLPYEAEATWSPKTKLIFKDLTEAIRSKKLEMHQSILNKAEYQNLYDKPYEDKKKIRVAGPFTVESLSPHRVLAVSDDDEFVQSYAKSNTSSPENFIKMILETLKTAGVQQSNKEDKINFTTISPWPGEMICAEGLFSDGDKAGVEKRAAIFIGPEFGTLSRPDLVAAAREASDADFDVLITCAFNYDAHSTDFEKLGRIPIVKARMNADLHMADEFKNTGKGNLFVVFGEPDIEIIPDSEKIKVKVNGVDVFHPSTGEVRSDGSEGIACWFVDTDYNEESFFVRHAYFLGANDPYKALKKSLKSEIDLDAWASLHSDISRPFKKPASGRIAVKVINHLGDEVMKIFKVT